MSPKPTRRSASPPPAPSTPPSKSTTSRDSTPPFSSRKAKRQARLKATLDSELGAVSRSPSSTPEPESEDQFFIVVSQSSPTTSRFSLSIPRSISADSMPTHRLLIASIGNPAPYLNTLHSAGHTVLASLAQTLQTSSFSKSRPYGNGQLATSPCGTYTLWQSPSLMNISGAALAVAWKAFNSQAGGGLEPKLVVLHDELELPLGQAKTKPGSQSPKGHNGLKSIRDLMRGVDYTRIGLGIGRPTSRDPDVVAGYVLRKMSPAEKAALVQLGGEGGKVTELVRQLAGDA